ncbi:hypothetical protein [Brasilonema sp. UFV-L1]|nr:hypothetical protein [Brasilonema sp. UFV-L1]
MKVSSEPIGEEIDKRISRTLKSFCANQQMINHTPHIKAIA